MKSPRAAFLIILACIWGWMCAGPSGQSAVSTFSLVDDAAAGTLTVREGGTDVLTYRYGDQLAPGVDARYTRSCYIHPLHSLDGAAASDDFPADHLHHRGLFWTWPVVETRGLIAQTWHPSEPRLRQHFVRFLRREADDGGAIVGVENEWRLEGEGAVARETVTIRAHPADDVGRAIDLEISLEPLGGPMRLRGSAEQDKGYGGLCLRGAPRFRGAVLTTDEGPLAADVTDARFRWADMSAGGDGVAVFVAADHPDYPTTWLIRNSYAGILNPSWPGLRTAELEPGRPAALRYRIYVHRGDVDSGRVRAAFRAFAAS